MRGGVSHNRPSQGTFCADQTGFACDELLEQNARSSRYEDSLPILGTARANISDQESALRCVGPCQPQNMCAWCLYTRRRFERTHRVRGRRGVDWTTSHRHSTTTPHHTTLRWVRLSTGTGLGGQNRKTVVAELKSTVLPSRVV